MRRLIVAASSLMLATPNAGSAQSDAETLMTRAVRRSGGDSALRAIRTASLEYVTAWSRTSFSDAPPSVSSIESNVDHRDYERAIWRYERRFFGAPQVIVDIVRDTVAIFNFGSGWQPLSGAYVDERRELFLIAPERLVVRALDAARSGALRTAGDTTIGGSSQARLTGTIDGFPVTLFVRRGDAQLTGLRYRAEQPWDFGLAAWGEMDVEVWYARWAVAGGIVVPFDIAIHRVGVPYKRLLVNRVQFNAPIPEDSVAISDSLRRRYVAEQQRAMFDQPVDSLRTAPDGIATFGVPGTPAAAVQRRQGWLLLGTGSAPLITRRALAAFRGAPVRAALVGTYAVGGAGGAPALSAAGVPLFASPGARRFLTMMFTQQRTAPRGITWVSRGGWHVVAGDSLWLEPIDLPDADGGLIAWDPAARWLYAGDALGPAQTRAVLDVVRLRGWPVERLFVRGAMTPIAEVRRMAGVP